MLVNTALLLDAVLQAGGIVRAATLWHVDTSAINRLFEGELPRSDALARVCKGMKVAPSQLLLPMENNSNASPFDKTRKARFVLDTRRPSKACPSDFQARIRKDFVGQIPARKAQDSCQPICSVCLHRLDTSDGVKQFASDVAARLQVQFFEAHTPCRRKA